MLHFNFSQESTQLLFWVVSDFSLYEAAAFKSAFNLTHHKIISPIQEKCSLSKNSTYIHMCLLVKLLSIEDKDVVGSSKDKRIKMLSFSRSVSKSSWYLAKEMPLFLGNLVIFLVPSSKKPKANKKSNFGIVCSELKKCNLSTFSLYLRKCWGKKPRFFTVEI